MPAQQLDIDVLDDAVVESDGEGGEDETRLADADSVGSPSIDPASDDRHEGVDTADSEPLPSADADPADWEEDILEELLPGVF